MTKISIVALLGFLATLSIPVAATAQTVAVDVPGVTPLQAIVRVKAVNGDGTPFVGSCTYRVSEGQTFSALVNDVNPLLFAGSNTDDRPGSIVSTPHRLFIVGARTAAKASDGKFYSRALQADTDHWVGVTCGSAPEQAATFRTENPPLGNFYPELPPFDTAAFGNVAVPTIDFQDRSKTYIDPVSGLLLKRLTSPSDYTQEVADHRPFTTVLDLSGSWQNAASATASWSQSAYTTVTTPNAPLFLPWSPGTFGSNHASFDASQGPIDIRLHSYCSATGGGALQACISLDSGQTCATDSIDISCPTSFADVAAPARYPAPMFSGWGIQSQTLSKNTLSTFNTPNVSVNGSTVTWNSESTRQIKFWANRLSGSKLMIPGTAPGCPNNICTVASWDSATQITIRENVSSPVTANMQDLGAGIRVWMKNTGGSPAVNAKFSYDYVTAEQFFGSTNAEFDTCSSLPITDIATDAQGTPLSSPATGYLCNLGQQGPSVLVLWVPATGDVRLVSNYYVASIGNHLLPPSNPFSPTDPKTFYAQDNQGNLWKGVLTNTTPGQYPEYVSPAGARTQDQVVWTNLSLASSPIDQQLAAYGGPAARAYATGLFPRFSFIGLIGGYAYYASQPALDSPCIRVRTSADTNQIVEAVTSFDNYPMRWGGCHIGAVGSGPLMALVGNAIAQYDPNKPVDGPFTMRITQILGGRGWRSFTQPISAASNASSVQFTSTGLGLDPNYAPGNTPVAPAYASRVGPLVTISGGTGAWAAVNGNWIATVVDTDHFTIPLDSSGFGSLQGSLTVTTAPPLTYSNIQAISSTTPAVLTLSQDSGPQASRFQDGDPVGFSADAAVQCYAKVSGLPNNQVALYTDTNLTVPVNGPSIQYLQNYGHAYLAQACPSDTPSQFLPGNMPLDTGATGIRCITLRVAGEPCSSFASNGEAAKYPCKTAPSDTTKSSLQDLAVGDAIRDLGLNVYAETLTLIKKVKNSESDMELTFIRWTPNLARGGDDHQTATRAYNHYVGWTPGLVTSVSHNTSMFWIDATDSTHSWIPADPNFAIIHGEFGHGNTANTVTYAAGSSCGYSCGAADSINNKSIRDLLATPLTYNHAEQPVWSNGDPKAQLAYSSVQTYPGHRQVNAAASEQVWKGDWGALNPYFGGSQTDGSQLLNGMTFSKIAGTAYDLGSTTSMVYKVSNPMGTLDRKRTPTYAWAGHFLLKDKSGPGSLIVDADSWRYCVADNAGECRPGSAQGDIFMSAPRFDDSGGRCITNTYNFTSPCIIGANPLGGWALQVRIDPIDSTASAIRRLTMGLTAPGLQWSFTTWLQTPGGKWGFFSAPYVNGLRNDYFAFKLPPWPNVQQGVDSVNRRNFVAITKRLPPAPGGAPFARIRFGYAENGDPANFYCTTRLESCSTEIPSVTANDPYSFLGETVTRQACDAGCSINIPAAPGRVVYYKIDRLDSSGNVIWSGPMEAQAVP